MRRPYFRTTSRGSPIVSIATIRRDWVQCLLCAACAVFGGCDGGRARVASTATGSGGSPPLAVTHVTVIDMTGAPPRPGMTVVVANGRIVAVGPIDSVSPPPGAIIVDGAGKYIIPGLWDMHVHSTFDRYERLVVLPLDIANGVTGVRDMAGDCFGACADKDTIDNPLHSPTCRHVALLGAGDCRPYSARPPHGGGERHAGRTPFQSGKGPSPSTTRPKGVRPFARRSAAGRTSSRCTAASRVTPTSRSPTKPRSAAFHSRAMCRRQSRSPRQPTRARPAWSISSEMAEACSSRSADVERMDHQNAMHPPKSPPEMGARIRARVTLLNASFSLNACAPLLQRFVRDGTWQVPTLTVLRGAYFSWDSAFTHDPRRQYMAPEDTAWWQARARQAAMMFTTADQAMAKQFFQHHIQIVGAMHRAGVGLLAGTDVSNPWVYWGSSLHDELAMFVDAGFTPLAALQAATIEPARFLHATDSLGTLEPGKVADLVILDADPLADIHNTQRINAVVVRGQLVDSAARQRLLSGARAAAQTM